MSMDFELTISGMCVLVLKSREDQPKEPQALEILCVDAHHHQPRLSYWPGIGTDTVRPSLCVDPLGRKHASLDVRSKVIRVDFGKEYKGQFDLQWGPRDLEAPSDEESEGWLNWVPRVQDLGIADIQLGAGNSLPSGASSRLILPPGTLRARDVVRDRDSGRYLLWEFPATKTQTEPPIRRALANEVVYRAEGVRSAALEWDEEQIYVELSEGTAEFGISNDVGEVPADYQVQEPELHHLEHLKGMATTSRAVVKVPKLAKSTRTGKPICNQVMFLS